jgi:cytoskeletal protein CcmA (bactofilin family)
MFELGKKEESGRDTDARASGGAARESAPQSAPTSAVSGGAPREVAIIGRSIRIDGDLQGEEDLRIEGDVNGTVRLHNNTLTIGSEGTVRADVYAKEVIVNGTMEGDLFSSERVAIHKSATVLGNITAPRVSLEDGAKFKGSMEMDPEAVKAAVAKTASATSGAKSNGDKPPAKPKAVAGTGAEAHESAA